MESAGALEVGELAPVKTMELDREPLLFNVNQAADH